MNVIRRGSELYVEVELRDRTTSPSSLFDPNVGVFFTLTNPSGTLIVNEAAMVRKDAGVYSYRYQTSASDALGVWSMEFKASHNTQTHLSLTMGAFEMVSA